MSETPPWSLQGQYAGFVTRLISFVIDILIINVAVLAAAGVTALMLDFFSNAFAFFPGETQQTFQSLGVIVTGAVSVVTLLLMLWLYPILFWMIGGQTLGKRLMGLRVVRMDGSRMTFWRGFVRVLGYWLAALPLFLGFLWVLFSNQRRGWHDMLADTCVIYSWEAKDSVVLRTRLAKVGHQLAGGFPPARE